MKRLSTVLIIIIFVLSFVSGYFLYQISDLEREKSDLQNRNSELENQISELESQIDEYQNQTSEMKNQIDELEQQNLELQNQTLELESLIAKFTNRVNITEFSVWGFNPWVGVTIYSHVNVTIQNLGINNVEGLTLIIVVNGDENCSETFPIDNLQVGQKYNIKTDVFWSLHSSGASVATLMLDDLVLDEYTLQVNFD